MRKKTTIPPLLKIIEVLAEHKEFEQYKMKNATGFSYRTILRALKPLEELKLIRHRTEPSEKGGKDKKIYAITFKGLYRHISKIQLDTPEGKEKLGQIACRFPEMLLFFKKWPLFVKARVQDKMLDYFNIALRTSLIGYKDRIRWFMANQKSAEHFNEFMADSDRLMGEFLDTYIIFSSLYDPENRGVLTPIYTQDQEIINLVNKVVTATEKHQKRIEEVQTWLRGYIVEG